MRNVRNETVQQVNNGREGPKGAKFNSTSGHTQTFHDQHRWPMANIHESPVTSEYYLQKGGTGIPGMRSLLPWRQAELVPVIAMP